MIDAVDRLFLARAVELAARGLFSLAENPRGGCRAVRNGDVTGHRWHARAHGLHAEANAIADPGGDVRDATASASREPCYQPPCNAALIAARVAPAVGAEPKTRDAHASTEQS